MFNFNQKGNKQLNDVVKIFLLRKPIIQPFNDFKYNNKAWRAKLYIMYKLYSEIIGKYYFVTVVVNLVIIQIVVF